MSWWSFVAKAKNKTKKDSIEESIKQAVGDSTPSPKAPPAAPTLGDELREWSERRAKRKELWGTYDKWRTTKPTFSKPNPPPNPPPKNLGGWSNTVMESDPHEPVKIEVALRVEVLQVEGIPLLKIYSFPNGSKNKHVTTYPYQSMDEAIAAIPECISMHSLSTPTNEKQS